MSSSRAALRLPDFRRLLIVAGLTTLASKSLQVVIGYQVYDITGDQMSLGWLGLVEAIPALSLVLFGGHFADRHDRRTIILITMVVALLCAVALALLALDPELLGLPAMYSVVFLAGVARGFAEPAVAAFEAQVVPREHYVGAAALQSSVWLGCAIIGPIIGGIVFGYFGPTAAYAMDAIFFVGALAAVFGMSRHPVSPPTEGESIFRSIAVGVSYVLRDQVLVGSMALDLFAVLFGGAVALLPVFAKDILQVGPGGLGMLNAAPYFGACVVMLWSTRYPPVRHAGLNLLVSVAGFGVSIIVFAFSTNLWLSLVALVFSGAFDGVSMVIRKSIVRAMAPAHMRGRVAAVSSIFIGASNELGAFESGFAATMLGSTVRSVWLGGVVTLIVVAGATALAPRLRRLNLMTAEPVE